MRTFKFVIQLDPIVAPTREEALKKAYRMLECYAESNDGSEFLANSTPVCVDEAPLLQGSSPLEAPPCGAEEQQR